VYFGTTPATNVTKGYMVSRDIWFQFISLPTPFSAPPPFSALADAARAESVRNALRSKKATDLAAALRRDRPDEAK
jgi:hypothetical protein